MAGVGRLRGAIVIVGLVTLLPFIYCGTRRPRRITKDRDEAIERLSKVFGIEKTPEGVKKHKTPPQYMMDLYNSIADKDGVTKTPSPFNADVVRSFPDKDSLHHMHFKFNTSHINDEKLLAAELHLFKIRPRAEERRDRSFHLVELKVYQVMDESRMWSPEHLRLLDAKRISAYSHGWEVFRVLPAVLDWINGTVPNHGFLLTARDLNGEHVNGSHIRFAQRNEHHLSKQPILVVFTDDGRRSQYDPVDPADQNLMAKQAEYSEDDESDDDDEEGSGTEEVVDDDEDRPRRKKKKGRNRNRQPPTHSAIRFLNEGHRARHGLRWKNKENTDETARSRTKRSKREASYYNNKRHKKTNCARHELYVDFDEIGWSGWIISPSGYNAYHCKGKCPFPLGQNQEPTNHATVQSIVHQLNIGKGIDTPCCVPNKLYPISLLYFDDEENVILKQYNDMVAASCGCH